MVKGAASVVLLVAFALVQTQARAQVGVRKLYVGAAFGAEAGFNVVRTYGTFEGDVFLGYRLAPWISVEGGYVVGVGNGKWRGEVAGAMCSGSDTHSPHRETADLRVWIHVLHAAQLDISLAPVFGFGLAVDDVSYGDAPRGPCFRPPQTSHALAFLGGMALGFELRASPVLGFRLVLENGIDTAMGVLYATAWVGPVLRF